MKLSENIQKIAEQVKLAKKTGTVEIITKIKWSTDPAYGLSGIHLIGMFKMSYDKLSKILGKGNIQEETGETNVNWVIKFDNNIMCDIYDWQTDVPFEKNNLWHIGGRGLPDEIELMEKLLGVKIKTK